MCSCHVSDLCHFLLLVRAPVFRFCLMKRLGKLQGFSFLPSAVLGGRVDNGAHISEFVGSGVL